MVQSSDAFVSRGTRDGEADAFSRQVGQCWLRHHHFTRSPTLAWETSKQVTQRPATHFNIPESKNDHVRRLAAARAFRKPALLPHDSASVRSEESLWSAEL